MSIGIAFVLILLNKRIGFLNFISKFTITEKLFNTKSRLLLTSLSMILVLNLPIFILLIMGPSDKLLSFIIRVLIGVFYSIAYTQAEIRNFYQ